MNTNIRVAHLQDPGAESQEQRQKANNKLRDLVPEVTQTADLMKKGLRRYSEEHCVK